MEAQACYSLGNTYTLLQDYERAAEYHLRHLLIAQELADRCVRVGGAPAVPAAEAGVRGPAGPPTRLTLSRATLAQADRRAAPRRPVRRPFEPPHIYVNVRLYGETDRLKSLKHTARRSSLGWAVAGARSSEP